MPGPFTRTHIHAGRFAIPALPASAIPWGADPQDEIGWRLVDEQGVERKLYLHIVNAETRPVICEVRFGSGHVLSDIVLATFEIPQA